MSDICQIKNPLHLAGTSQANRLIPALLPDYVSVDERTLADLLNLAWEFSRSLQYYAADNKPDGNWQHFFEHNPCMLIARIDILAADQPKKINDLNALSDVILSLASEFNDYYVYSIAETRFHADLERMIMAQLRDALSNSKIVFDGFHSIWSVDVGQVNAGDVASLPDLQSARQTFLNARAQLAEQSETYLDEALSTLSSHEPHLALLITFFYLLKYAQDELNQMSKRHLDFYYQDVLKFTANDLQPDKAHVLFELKAEAPHLLAAETLLKAGHDAAGKQVVYQTKRDIVVNKASIGQLKTVFIDAADHDRVYAAPVANSADGLGAAFEREAKWKSFGERNNEIPGSMHAAANSTFANIGFAIASPMLLLNEGDRDIQLEFSLTERLDAVLRMDHFKILLTSSAGWLEITSFELSVGDVLTIRIRLGVSDPAIVGFDAALHDDAFDTDQPVAKIVLRHIENIENADYAYESLRKVTFSACTVITTVGSIGQQEQAAGVQATSLANDIGSLKTTKAFYPFTVAPELGSSLYIGSHEVFQKQLVALSISMDWKALPVSDLAIWYNNYAQNISNASFKVSVSLLVNHAWQLLDEEAGLFVPSDAKQTQHISFARDVFSPPLTLTSLKQQDVAVYSPASSRGFLQLKLTAPAIAFGHADYSRLYTTAIIAYANNPSDEHKAAIPNRPYSPEIESLRLHYKASERIIFGAKSVFDAKTVFSDKRRADTGLNQFFHVYPFGHKQADSENDKLSLLPPFQYELAKIKYDSQGELYIGLLNLEPRQNLSLLFQVAEGSADPEVHRPDISWSYLAENHWLPFHSTAIISDSTQGLLSSGVMVFDIPKQATSDNTILAAGLHWIRASVAGDTTGICDLVDVHAQAVEVSFVDQANDPAFLAEPTASKTINALSKKDPLIQSVYQPYASFDGRMKEQDVHLYVRASERLRHKDRGITIWDYEHLVLQAFPDIYKVKCINHSSWDFQDSRWHISASEFSPGFVSLIVIPNLKNKNMVNPLEPRTSVGEMAEIKAFLAARISPFAAQGLQILNPMYEAVEVELAVRFRAGYDWGFYARQLNEELIAYLSPWLSGDKQDIEFGASIHKSVILNFIEERHYVDYVIDYKMHLLEADGTGAYSNMNVEEAIPTSARTIFVSAASHRIIEASH